MARDPRMLIKLFVLVLPLGLDGLAASAAIGLAGLEPRQRLRISLLMAGFEGGMPLIGLALGAPLAGLVGGGAEYGAGAVLIAVGLSMLVAKDDDGRGGVGRLASASGWSVLLLGLGVSLDELAIGFTLGLLHVSVVLVVILIAVQAVLVTQLGLRLGARLGSGVREGVERTAGLALVAVGVGLLGERLLGA